jgi:hypothetical protein
MLISIILIYILYCRCVVRTLATTEAVLKRVSLDFDNFTLYKDHCLVNWILTEDYG